MTPSLQALHAHWDCFGGATDSSILAACLNVDPEHQLARDIERRIRAGLSGCLTCLKTLSLQVSHSVVASMQSALVCVVVEDEITAAYNLKEVRIMLTSSDSSYIPDPVREKAEEVFVELATAESWVHGHSWTMHTKFTVPTIVHVVGTLLGLHILNVGTVSCGRLPLGEGSTWSEDEGLLPVPSPTTLLLLVGMATCPGPPSFVTEDLITPTAAALLRVLTKTSRDDGPTQRPACFATQNIGVGADVDGETIRVLRVLIGDATDTTVHETSLKSTDQNFAVAPQWTIEKLTHLETNLDDMTAEALAFAVQILLDNGAVDAWVAPIVMKKGRAAHTLHCLCRSDDSSDTMAKKLLQLVFRHTTTLGIQIHRNIERAASRRSFLTIQTPFSASKSKGEVKVKIGYLGEDIKIKAEFDDCAAISRETGMPIQQVADYATHQVRTQLQAMKSREST
jgi:uncharacterized protein (DUF111 family)